MKNKIQFLTVTFILTLLLANCGRKKCLTCTDVTYIIAKQADYDAGYKPDVEHSCVGDTYGENGEFKTYTYEDLVEKKELYDARGNYECKWD